jgi:hypothetical protein
MEWVVFAVAGLIGVAALLAVAFGWRAGVIGFIVWMTIEDLLRQHTGNSLLVYVAKDVLFVIVLGAWLVWHRRTRPPAFPWALKVALGAWFVWAVVELLNPNLTHLVIGLVGLRMSFFYIPLLFIGYGLGDTARHVRTFLVVLLTLGAAVAAVGVMQSVVDVNFLHPEDVSPYLRPMEIRESPDTALEIPRVASVFVDPGRFSQYLFVTFFVGLALLGLFRGRPTAAGTGLRLWVWGCLGLVTTGLFISGQKAAVLWVVLTLPFAVLCHVVLRTPATRSPVPWAGFACAVAVGVVVLTLVIPERFEAATRLHWESLSPWSPYTELAYRPRSYLEDIIVAAESEMLIGHGTGTASLGLQYLTGFLPPDALSAYVEGGYAAVVWEWGLVGLALWLGWTLTLLQLLFRAAKSLVETPYYALSLMTLAYALFLLFPWFYLGMQMYQQYVAQTMLWLLSGLVLGLAAKTRAAREVGRR